jgi:NAD(P)H-dependent flavin oxidoreductase YrpB (nitropropane dioxygenase family)
MWSNRRLVELFKIEHPIVLAPMAGFCTVDLAAAVSNAGGIGSIGCAVLTPELIAKTVAELRRLTTKPINLNFFATIRQRRTPLVSVDGTRSFRRIIANWASTPQR